MTTTETVLTHKWQEQGLGVAPFDAVTIISTPSTSLCEANPTAYNYAMAEASRSAIALGVTLGSCYSCGMPLVNNVVIRDANRKHFVVGCDCAAKTHDCKLITRVEQLERARQKAIREARQQEERRREQAEREARLQAERERNGGLTNHEVAEKQREEAEARRVAVVTEKNEWLINVLWQVSYVSDFVASVRQDLTRKSLTSLSQRCLDILAEIYAKQVSGSRKGSKAYKAAEAEFWGKVESEQVAE